LAISLTSTLAIAGDAKDSKDLKKVIEDQGIYVETAQKGITLSGYVDTSYTYQFAGKTANQPASARSEANRRQFDTDHNDFNINAFKLALEKQLPKDNVWAAGFRADLIVGEDGKILDRADTGLFSGVGTGGEVALEQAYVSFRVPVGNGLDFKVGKFVTLLGYEVIESPLNLNFSRGLLFTNAIPLTHTGFLASYKFNDIVDAQFGVVNGWNTSDSSSAVGTESGFGSKAITGRVNVTAPGGNANIANSFIWSPDGESNSGLGYTENESIFVWDVVGNWTPKFGKDKLLLGFNADLGVADDGGTPGLKVAGTNNDVGGTWWGAAVYAKYQFTKLFSLAGRGEYFHDSNGTRIGTFAGTGIGGSPGIGNAFTAGRGGSNPVDLYSFTLTAGFDIWENLLTRVEYRGDYGDRSSLGNDHFQHQIAVNLVYSF
jgi:hypothetical protein